MAEQELNKLPIKSDSLPDSWLITLVNPVTGSIAENMTVAKFIELIFLKLPLASENNNGLMGTDYYTTNLRCFFIDINDFAPNTKQNTGFSMIGLYYISDGSGNFEVIGISSYAAPVFHVAGKNLATNGNTPGFLIQRDVNDGAIFVTNKFSVNVYFSMWKV